MSDEEIRDLLGRGTQDLGPEEGAPPEELWAAGRRERARGRAWLGGLGAAAAAAGMLGIVWAQGLAGGQTTTGPADTSTQTSPGPVVDDSYDGRGEPFFAVFHLADAEPVAHLSGASEPATLEDLQVGLWIGPDGEQFAFNGDELTAVLGGCTHLRGAIALDADSRLVRVGDWEGIDDLGECTEPPAIPWGAVLQAQPMLSVEGQTLIVSGFDGTTEEPRVPAALTLGQVDDSSFTWADAPALTGVTPLTLGDDVALLLSGSSDESGFTSIDGLQLEERPGAADAAQSEDVEGVGYPGTCPLILESSLRSDGALLAGPPAPFSACNESSDAPLPPFEPSPAVVELLRSGPMIGFNGEHLIISGTVPESLLEQTSPPVVEDGAPTTEDPSSDEPTGDDLPVVTGRPTLVVLAEQEWEHTGTLAPLTNQEAADRRWRPVDLTTNPPTVSAAIADDWGLTFDGTTWRYRECGIDVSAPGSLENGQLILSGEVTIVPDPDPDAGCAPPPLLPDEWADLLSSEPRLFTDGQVLVISGGLGDQQLTPYSKGLSPDAVADPNEGPTAGITTEDLVSGLSELPVDVAVNDLGLSDVGDALPGHDTTLRLDGPNLLVDTSCGAVDSGPAWIYHAGPEETDTQLIAALPSIDCSVHLAAAPAPAAEAELWREMLARGAFAYRFGDYVILDGWATPGLTPPG